MCNDLGVMSVSGWSLLAFLPTGVPLYDTKSCGARSAVAFSDVLFYNYGFGFAGAHMSRKQLPFGGLSRNCSGCCACVMTTYFLFSGHLMDCNKLLSVDILSTRLFAATPLLGGLE